MQPYRPIQTLPDSVVKKIAAGEVIERPASIVKELMENSVDAGSTKIDVHVTNGGISLILVEDNGSGIAPDEIELAVVKNATSKIMSEKDLQSIHSFGFRGEALSSISSVSKFELQTKRKQDSSGTLLRVDGGLLEKPMPIGTADGTRIQVSHLFFNVPARKKFLRSKTTEFSHVEKAFKKIALAHPQIRFSLYKDGTTYYSLEPCSPVDRIVQLFPNTKGKLSSFDSNHSGIVISGYISNHHETFDHTGEIWTFVNHRWVTDRTLQKAIVEGYRSALMNHQYPTAFLFLDVPPDSLDINIHPAKAEVKFEKPQEIFLSVSRAVSNALRKEPASHTIPVGFSPRTYPASLGSMALPMSHVARERPVEWAAPIESSPIGFFSSLSYLGHIDHTYLCCKSDTSLILIDQHAAHERILFQKINNGLKSKIESQSLLIPISIELSPSKSDQLREIQHSIEKLGFGLEEFGEHSWILRTIPSFVSLQKGKQMILDWIEKSLEDSASTKFQDSMDHLSATLACHSAVRAHDVLEIQEVRELLKQMDEVDLSSYCPHGRPTFLQLSTAQLESLFKR